MGFLATKAQEVCWTIKANILFRYVLHVYVTGQEKDILIDFRCGFKWWSDSWKFWSPWRLREHWSNVSLRWRSPSAFEDYGWTQCRQVHNKHKDVIHKIKAFNTECVFIVFQVVPLSKGGSEKVALLHCSRWWWIPHDNGSRQPAHWSSKEGEKFSETMAIVILTWSIQ